MVILGIDPGIATTGYGVVEKTGTNVTFRTCGVIVTAASTALPERLLQINAELNVIFDRYAPDVLASENLFFGKNVTSAMQVGSSLGIVLLCAAQRGIPWAQYRPAEVKMAVAGYGAAEKPQVQAMVKQLLKLESIPKPDDAADALAIAICHAYSATINSLRGRATT